MLLLPYKTHLSDVADGHEVLLSSEKKKIPLKISGKHNLQSISAAKEVVKKIGVTSEMFYQATLLSKAVTSFYVQNPDRQN